MGISKIAVIGSGAVGGFYGAKLQTSGKELHFLFHNDYEVVKQEGLRVDSVQGDMWLTEINAYRDAGEMPKCDLVIVALKVVQNGILKEILPRILAPGGIVLTLQNGMGADDGIASIVGPDHVMGGLCFICSNRIAPGHIRHLDYGGITLGHYAPDFGRRGVTPELTEVAECLAQAGIKVDVIEDLFMGRWKKLVWNIPYNGMSVVLNETTDRMVADPDLRPLFRELMEEVALGAAAYGREITPDFIAQMIGNTDKMKPYETSMMLDFLNRRPMEIEAIYGMPLKLAKARGVDLPKIETLYRELLFIDRRNRISRG